jgi:hypothetical protein
MQELAVGQYRAFITSAECTTAVREQVAGMRQHLEALQQARTQRPPRAGAGCIHCVTARPPRPLCRLTHTRARAPPLARACQGLPALSEGCANFAEAAERIAAARAQNRQLLQQHGCVSPARARRFARAWAAARASRGGLPPACLPG